MNESIKCFVETHFDKPGKVLDLGAGNFSDVHSLQQMGWIGEGVDISMGVNLEHPFFSKHGPFDLVIANYVIHKLKNKKQLVKTAYDNLKTNGWFFVQTFDMSDKTGKWKSKPSMRLSAENIRELLEQVRFINISEKVFDFYDYDEGHKHWHRILEVVAQKQP